MRHVLLGFLFLCAELLLGYWLAGDHPWLIWLLVLAAIVVTALLVISETKARRSRIPDDQVWSGEVRSRTRVATFSFRMTHAKGGLLVGEGFVKGSPAASRVVISGSISQDKGKLTISPADSGDELIEEIWSVSISGDEIVGRAAAKESGIDLGDVTGRLE